MTGIRFIVLLLPTVSVMFLSDPLSGGLETSSGTRVDFPMAVGNAWVWDDWNDGETDTVVTSIVGDTVMPNGRLYYRFSNSIIPDVPAARMDTERIFYWNEADETESEIFRLDAAHLEEWLIDPPLFTYFSASAFHLDSLSFVAVFGDTVRGTSYDFDGLTRLVVHMSEKYGPYHLEYWQGGWPPWPLHTRELIGAVIDDTSYGYVPTWVSVNDGVEEVPEEFVLHQNYPNSFNPATTFEFSLRSSLFANLSVYDLLGREIAVLVNEKLTAGTHTVRWDASGLPSGVYFYRMLAGSSVETRRLVLLR